MIPNIRAKCFKKYAHLKLHNQAIVLKLLNYTIVNNEISIQGLREILKQILCQCNSII